MANLFAITKVFRPRRTIKSEDHNTLQTAIEAAFNLVGTAPPSGFTGVSTPFYVGTATDPNHAATKAQLDTAESGATAQAAASAVSASASDASAIAAAASETAAGLSEAAAASSESAAGVSETNAAASAASVASTTVADLNDVTLTTISASQFLQRNAGNTGWENVTLADAGALMDSEVDADIKTLTLPASTTISTFGASLIDDAAASDARTTLALGSADSVTFNAVTDALGELRQIPSPDAAKTGAYSLDAGDVGTVVPFGTGGLPTIPNSVLSEDDVITLVNETSGDITITCTIATAYVAGVDVATATLSAYGTCTILFRSGTLCHITGDVT